MVEFKHLVRVVNSDIKGEKKLIIGLCSIPGVSVMLANAVCNIIKLDINMKSGNLTDQQVAKIEAVLTKPKEYGLPDWMLNRRNDPETGETSHLLSSDVKFVKEKDLRRLKKVKSYRGMRHAWKLPVRGQKTKSNFRKNKGMVKGVKRKKGKK